MTKINTIVTGHGNFASGLGSSLRLLAGQQENIKLIDFTESMDEESLSEKLKEAMVEDTPTLFFTDLAGGTPFKEAAKISIDRKNVEVVAGCNLASLLESVFVEYDNVLSYAENLVKISKNTAQVADFSDDGSSEDEAEDGI